ncbi:MAG: hypothetical protein V1749_03925 [Candidatus Desantisbacteria bacterium]
MKIRRNAKLLTTGIVMLIMLAIFAVYIKQQQQVEIRENTIENFPAWKKVNQFIDNGWDFKIGETKDEIIKNFGNPDDNASSETCEWFYDDLYIKFIKGIKGDEIVISSVIITSDKYKTKWGLNVGSSKKKVLEILGKPYKRKILVDKSYKKIPVALRASYDEEWTYLYIEGASSCVTFSFKDDIIYHIEWELYTG